MSSCSSIDSRRLRSAAARGLALGAGLALGVGAGSAAAGHVRVPGTGFRSRVESVAEARFRATVRQQHDFSCGAAAVATLLRHHYGRETSEAEVFRYMWEAGDREQIQAVGFSLLDMKRFLSARGYAADGYRIPLTDLASAGTPAIALVATQGYRHFVVIQGISEDAVLVSDPALGRRALPRPELERIRHEVMLVVHPDRPASRPLVKDWRLRPAAPLTSVPRALPGLSRDALLLPVFGGP